MAGDRKIGVALDFSKSSKRALEWAIDNLLGHGETLVVLHVRHPKSSSSTADLSSDSAPIPLSEFRELEVLKRYDLEVDALVLDALDTAARQKEAIIVLKLYAGDPREKLCDAVEDLKLDSLVMGCRGLGQIQSFYEISIEHTIPCWMFLQDPSGQRIKPCSVARSMPCYHRQRTQREALTNPPPLTDFAEQAEISRVKNAVNERLNYQ
ncbi:universal stress protein PHOS32-like isoform X1 [Zingiber officinale]|uniref:universal stress protein PHOS32-like isoform X1 n=1 Tax=Zingiber officinale TaxID=94328 RepID=UPI001C4B0A39|nr:universal stress protein PHOS32-like isoform X1 [Zingiber officinale]